jgi:AcrR family transcriptional regulator
MAVASATRRVKRSANRRASISRPQYAALQRGRLIAAVYVVLQEVGYERLTVARISARAKVSRKTFYETFNNCEDAFLAAFEQAAEQLREVAVDAYGNEPDWRSGIRAALHRVLTLLEEQPGIAKLCLVDTLAGGEGVLRRRAELIDELACAIDQGRAADRAGRTPSPLTAEILVGGTLSLLGRRLSEREKPPLVKLRCELMSVLILPYLGARSARSELVARCGSAATPACQPAPALASDPLKDLGLRLTYRTMRTLMAIADDPGASNRDIAEQAGIVDQGQVSKLLSRLARLGLIENYGVGQPRGGANAWQLTAKGARLEQASRPRLA